MILQPPIRGNRVFRHSRGYNGAGIIGQPVNKVGPLYKMDDLDQLINKLAIKGGSFEH